MLVHLIRLAGAHANFTVAQKWLWNLISGVRLGRIITNISLNDYFTAEDKKAAAKKAAEEKAAAEKKAAAKKAAEEKVSIEK